MGRKVGVARRKLPIRAARKKSVLEKATVDEPATVKSQKTRVRTKTRIADMPEERQVVVRKQNRDATAKKRAKGGKALKIMENKLAEDCYVKKIIIVSVVLLYCGICVATPFQDCLVYP